MKAGFAVRDITPPLGKEIPGLFHQRFAEGIHDPLCVRAAVVDDGRGCVAMVQCDTIKVSAELTAAARNEARRLCGIAPKSCFLSATHTHSGGPVFGSFISHADPDYVAYVALQAAHAIADAYRKRRPVMVGTGAVPAEGIAFNRRFLMKDGAQTTHPGKMHPDIVEPAGPADPTVTVVGFRPPDAAEPTGCIVNFACHATHMNGVLYSADYPAWIARTLKAVYGPEFEVVFLNGACGDVTQVDNRSERPGEFGEYWCKRTGRAVGAAAAQALAKMDYYREAGVAAGAKTLSAAIRKSTPEARRAARDLLSKKGVSPDNIETIYAHCLFMVERMRRDHPEVRLEIMGVRIADALFWGVPGEYFQAFAQEVKAASPFPHTCCVELANGYYGYICTADAFAGGGYEIRTAPSSFLVEDTGARVARAGAALARAMHRDAEGELRRLPGLRVWESVEDGALDGIKQLRKRKRR